MIEVKEKFKYLKVKPVIIYPKCILAGRKQDCFNCGLFKTKKCNSPRSFCAREYPGHKKGCPNYGKYNLCPPDAPMFDEIFDMDKDIFLIYFSYDIKSHLQKMKTRHPNWTERQLRNVLYWQGTAKKLHKEEIKEFLTEYGHLGYEVITPEALGVDVTKTLEKVGINLEWPPMNYSYRIAFAGIPKKGKSIKGLEKNKNNKLTNF